jgi:hypothetical protein
MQQSKKVATYPIKVSRLDGVCAMKYLANSKAVAGIHSLTSMGLKKNRLIRKFLGEYHLFIYV